MVDLAPGTPYETALVENLVTLEWESIRHRNIRDQLILSKFRDLSMGALQYAEIKSIRGERIDQEVHEEARALMSPDPRQRAVGLSALEERHINPTELLAEAYTEVRHAIEVHEYKLSELEIRRRRLREDYDRLKAARAKPVEDAEVLRGYPDEEQNRVSHETIYRSLYVQTRGVLKKELQECLRSPRAIRRSRHATQKGLKLRKIKDAIPISERPPEVKDRAVPGHWEGDLIVGSNNSYIATLVERHSRFVMLAKIENKDTQSVITALIKQARKLPKELYKSLTWDRGSEMAGHHKFTIVTKIDVYFCDPQSPWQRGSNENTNRLLRQYFPKGTDISGFSQAKLSAVARQLNERPRKTL